MNFKCDSLVFGLLFILPLVCGNVTPSFFYQVNYINNYEQSCTNPQFRREIDYSTDTNGSFTISPGRFATNEKPGRIRDGRAPYQQNLAWLALFMVHRSKFHLANKMPREVKSTLDGTMLYRLCTGILIDKEWVLTAAHCVEEMDSYFDRKKRSNCTKKHEIVVRLAGRDLVATKPEFAIDVAVDHWFVDITYFKKAMIPNKVGGLGGLHDVALLHLDYTGASERVRDFIRKAEWDREFVCLPPLHDDFDSLSPKQPTNCFVAGWGVGRKNVATSKPLVGEVELFGQDVKFKVGNTTAELKCAAQAAERICARPYGGTDDGMLSCFGDSGGPILCRTEKDAMYRLRGVISSGLRNISLPAPEKPTCDHMIVATFSNLQSKVTCIRKLISTFDEMQEKNADRMGIIYRDRYCTMNRKSCYPNVDEATEMKNVWKYFKKNFKLETRPFVKIGDVPGCFIGNSAHYCYKD